MIRYEISENIQWCDNFCGMCGFQQVELAICANECECLCASAGGNETESENFIISVCTSDDKISNQITNEHLTSHMSGSIQNTPQLMVDKKCVSVFSSSLYNFCLNSVCCHNSNCFPLYA